MPHCIIEYAEPLNLCCDVQSIVCAVHQGAFNTGLFESDDIKTRAVAYAYYQVGEEVKDFIHVTIKLLSGRTAAQKSLLCSSVLNALKLLDIENLSITVEAVDIDRESYAKHVSYVL